MGFFATRAVCNEFGFRNRFVLGLRNQSEIKKIYESLNSDIKEILEIKEFKKIKEKINKLR